METYTEINITRDERKNYRGEFKLILVPKNKDGIVKEFTFFTRESSGRDAVEFHIQYKNLSEDFICCEIPYGKEILDFDFNSLSEEKQALFFTFIPTIDFAIKKMDASHRGISAINNRDSDTTLHNTDGNLVRAHEKIYYALSGYECNEKKISLLVNGLSKKFLTNLRLL